MIFTKIINNVFFIQEEGMSKNQFCLSMILVDCYILILKFSIKIKSVSFRHYVKYIFINYTFFFKMLYIL